MKKGLLKNSKMGDYEKEKGYASYRTIVDYFIGDIVLCNEIVNVDESVYYNMVEMFEPRYYDENDIEISEEEFYENDNAYCDDNVPEIYQYYICNISEYEKQQLKEMGIILSYSDKLECDVLCVDHYGTSWDYVLTDVKLFDNYEDLEKYES